jgi:hypothetical protein
VRAFNASGWSDYSEKRFFKTAFIYSGERKFFLDKFVLSGRRAWVTYRIPQYSEVRLELYDVRGKMVSQVIRRDMPPGAHTESIPTRQLPCGHYFLSLRAGSHKAKAAAPLLR